MNDAPVLIPLQSIHPNPYQIRQAEDPEAVAELADNIKKNGLLQPPTVRAIPVDKLADPVEKEYELVFGHTRLAAFKILADQESDEYGEMPCFIRTLDNLQMFEMAVAENIKRRDLNPVEQAAAMKRYMQDFGKSSQEAGEFFGVDEATVRGTVRLLGLPEVAKEKLSSGEITIGAARKLLVLVRVAPDSIGHAVQRILEGDLPDKVIEGALDGIVYHNKAIKMWASWHNGKPQAGSGLWELDTPTKKFSKYMPPIAGLEGVDIRLAKKALEGEELTAQNRPQLEDWVHKLQSGLVAPEALIAQGAPADTIERLEQLVHPPACTACPFYVKADNNHYCTWKVCHTRKKEAWCYSVLESTEKSLNIKALSTDEARGGFVALEHVWDKAENELVESKDPNLRLHIKPQQYTHGFTGSEMVEVVTIAAKAVEEKKVEKKEESRLEREERYARAQKLRSASEKFVETEAMPVFVHLLDILDNLGFLMALANMRDDDFEPEAGEKAPTRKEKLQLCRMAIIEGILDTNIDYDIELQGPLETAGQLQGVARTWGVELPADWLERAASYWPKDVAVETEKA